MFSPLLLQGKPVRVCPIPKPLALGDSVKRRCQQCRESPFYVTTQCVMRSNMQPIHWAHIYALCGKRVKLPGLMHNWPIDFTGIYIYIYIYHRTCTSAAPVLFCVVELMPIPTRIKHHVVSSSHMYLHFMYMNCSHVHIHVHVVCTCTSS